VQLGVPLVPPVLYLPAGQSLQVIAPDDDSVPAAQTEHDEALPPANFPAGQMVQLDEMDDAA
jgi:hypothetical protein